MESSNSMTPEMESPGEDIMLIETVKNIVTHEGRNETEGTEADFFLISQDHTVQYPVGNVQETESHTHHQTEVTLEWMHFCRICARTSNRTIHIFDGNRAEHDLLNKIHKYLPIHVSERDTLPLQVCEHCANILMAWHELSEGCLNAERKLLEMQDTQLRNKQQEYYSTTSLENLDVTTPILTTTGTIVVPNSIDSLPNQPDDNKNEVCDTRKDNKFDRSCDVRTPFRVSPDTQKTFWKPYRKRCQPRTRSLIKPSAAPAEDPDSVWFVVDTTHDRPSTVSEQLESNDRLSIEEKVEHDMKVEQRSIKNSDCEDNDEPWKITVPHEEKRSERDQISDGDDTIHSILDDEKNDKSLCDILRKTTHKEESYRCTECGRCFKLKDSYLRHMRIHKDERPFTCHVCGKQFRDSGGLTRHLKDVHAKLKNFTCDICSRSFASKATRDDHRRTHTGERPFVCDSCGKTFKSKASLYIHSKLHTDVFPHVCTYCGKQFRRRQELLAHVTMHTGEKNHGCDVCERKFRVKSELARHKLIHSESKPFTCAKCGLAFRQKRYLNNHIKSRHNESLRASYEMPEERTFAAYRSLRSTALWARNTTMRYKSDPTRSMTLIAENAKKISERDTCDSSDNCNAEKYEWTILQSTSESAKDYTCDNCQCVFKRKHHLIHHLADCKHHASVNEKDLSGTRVKVTKKKKKTNNGTIREKSRLVKMIKGTKDDKGSSFSLVKSSGKRSRVYLCRYCEHTAEKRILLQAHMVKAHPEVTKASRKSFITTETVMRARMEHDGKVYYHCNECGKNLNSPYTYYWHLRIHTGERMFTCHLCGKRFRVNQGLARHLKETHAGVKNIPCDLCGRMFSTRRYVEDHRRIHTGERPYVCNVCGKTFKQKASLFVHNRTHTDVFPHKCSHCGQTFRTRAPLMLHITKHTGEKPHTCDVCGRSFRIKYEMKRHRLIHSDEKPWGCTDCSLSFRQKRYLVSHKKQLKNQIVTHDRIIARSYSRRTYKTGERRNKIDPIQTSNIIDEDSKSIFSPTDNIENNKLTLRSSPTNVSPKISDKLANDKKEKRNNIQAKSPIRIDQTRANYSKETKSMQQELVAEANESNEYREKNVKRSKAKEAACTSPAMVCEFCDKKFRTRKKYWAHLRTHSGEKSCMCHICGKQFVQGGSLYYHMKHVHEGVKNHTCDICGRKFAMKTAMEDHRRIHTGERPYVCHTCGKTFKTKASLYIHSKTHTDEFPYKCTYCAKRFRWRQQMLGHLTVHTGEKNHTCDICGKGFGVKNDLTRHKRVHSDEKPYTCQQCGISFGQKRYLKSHERLKLGTCGYSRSSNQIELKINVVEFEFGTDK